MRRSIQRSVAFVAVVAVSASITAPAAAQAQDGQPSNQLHYPLAEELAGMLRGADAAREAGRLEEALDLYRMVLDSDKAGRAGYQVALLPEAGGGRPAVAGVTPVRRYVGITEWAINSLRTLPPEGVKLFRARYDYRAASAVDEAKAARDPFVALARAYELFPISSHAPRVLEAMADLALERGELERAHQTLERLVAHHGADLADPPRVRKKLLVCALTLGKVDRVRELARELMRDDPKGRVHLGGGPVSVDELVARALEAHSRRTGKADGAKAALDLVRGDAANRATSDAKPSIGAPRFNRTFELDRGPQAARPFSPGQVSQAQTNARHLPLLHDGRVFVATADQVLTYDADDGAEGPRIPRLGPALADPNDKVQFGAAIERDTLVAPLVDEVLRDQQYRGIPIKVKIPVRKLAGFDLGGWRWAWSHARSLDGTPLERWSFPTPPVAVEGVVYAPAFSIEGFVNSYVAAFDARTGERLWDTWVVSGQVEQTMFGEQATEPLCTPVAVRDGIVYHSTSFGCVSALDATTGRPLWITEYEQLEVRAPRGYYADPRTISWENNAPVVEAGVVVAAPLDSPRYMGLDARTGERLWTLGQRSAAASGEMRYIMGACETGEPQARQGVVVLGGGGEVRCLSMRTGKLLWYAPLRGRVVAGRGCIAQGVVLVPVDRNEVLLFEVETGKRVGNFNVAATGNVALVGEHALVTGNGVLAVHKVGGASSATPPQHRGQDF